MRDGPLEEPGQTKTQTRGQRVGHTRTQALKQAEQTRAYTLEQTAGQTQGLTPEQTGGQTRAQALQQTARQIWAPALEQTADQTRGQTIEQTIGQTRTQTLEHTVGQTQAQTVDRTAGQTWAQTLEQTDEQTEAFFRWRAASTDLASWLERTELIVSTLPAPGQAAAVLRDQIRQQQALHLEMRRSRPWLQEFGRLTQQLMTDGRDLGPGQVSGVMAHILQRHSRLGDSVLSRGRDLHAAVSSLCGFDSNLEHFSARVAEIETQLARVEGQVGLIGGRTRRPAAGHAVWPQRTADSGQEAVVGQAVSWPAARSQRRFSDQQQGLQTELSCPREEPPCPAAAEEPREAGLPPDQPEPTARRWERADAARSAAELGEEGRSGLLLSLRELLEWVIRRETELNLLEPLAGDSAILQQRQEDVETLQNQLQDRQALISGKLSTARAVSSASADGSESGHTQDRPGLDREGRDHRPEAGQDRSLARAIGREATKLQDKWQQLLHNTEQHRARVDRALTKLRVLEKCLQDVDRRLSDLEQSGDVITDSDVTEERLLEVRRSLDDVTDQAGRLAENGVPLGAAQAARLEALAGRLRSLTSLLSRAAGSDSVDLSLSVDPPWERAETERQVPYYLHHGERRTQWEHPRLAHLLRSLHQLDAVRFTAYRTALKLRRLQRALLLHRLTLPEAAETFESQAWRLPAAGAAAVPDVLAVLTALYGRLEPALGVELPLRVDLCLNWLLCVYDSRRTGQIPVSSFKLAIITLCKARLEEKYRYMFQLAADSRQRLDERQLGRLLGQLLQLPARLGEAAAFGAGAVQPSVSSCFQAAAAAADDEEPGAAGRQPTLCEAELLEWLRAEPQSLVWLPVLHRVAGAETARHQARCNGCKQYPILGFRYRCLRCFNFDMCQQCFFTGRVAKSHKLSHPMHEYCTESSSSDDIKDFTRSFRNKFKPKHYFRKHAKLGYLPVQPMGEDQVPSGSPASADDLSPVQRHRTNGRHHSDADNHSVSSPESEDELQLMARYCLSLSSDGVSAEVRDDQLRAVIRQLEEENRSLQAEYLRLAGSGRLPGRPAATNGAASDVDSPPAKAHPPPSEPTDPRSLPTPTDPEPASAPARPQTPPGASDLQPAAGASDGAPPQPADEPPVCPGRPPAADPSEGTSGEAGSPRQHGDRLQTRMQALDEHNRQLGQQLSKLRRLLNGGTSLARSSTLQTRSVTASHLACEAPAAESGGGHDSVTNGGVSKPVPLAFSLAVCEPYSTELTSA